MKSLLIVAGVVLVAGASGCRNCRHNTTTYRPCAPVATAAPCCVPTATEYSSTPIYSTPDVITPTPALPSTTIPSTTIPGPEAYTPAP
jgi:hypothetical protein